MKVFLSYKRTDLAAASQLLERMRAQRPDWEIYFDLDQLCAGAFWTEALDKALQEASAFVFLIGAEIGDWQRMEYAMALRRKVKTPSLPLLPLVLPDGRRDRLAFIEAIQQIDWGGANAAEALAHVIRGIEEGPQQAPELWRLVSPYRGLEALGVEDAGFLYGRDADLDRLLERLAQEREPKILTILGASGVGKSSFVKAGLFAALLRESRRPAGEEKSDWPAALQGSRRWLMASLRPGVSPLRELAKTIVGWTREDPEKPSFQSEVEEWRAYLMKPGFDLQGPLEAAKEGCRKLRGIWPERILLHVDQAEELYAQASPEEARRFSEVLAASRRIPGFQTLLTMRSDYYPELQKDRPLLEAGERIDLLPLEAEGLAAMIRQPAAALGAVWEEPKLPERLQAMASSDPENGAPLLSHALSKLWSEMQARDDGKLRGDPASDLSDFLISKVDRARDFGSLRRLFALRLTRAAKDDHGRVRFLRRRARQEEMTPEEWRLAQKLAGPEFRLLRLGWGKSSEQEQGFAEVAHESLLRTSWFGEWVKADEAFALWLAGIEQAAEVWLGGGRTPDALLMGRALNEAESWRLGREADLTPLHREFLDRSRQWRKNLEAQQEAERLAHEAEKEKRRQVERRMSRRTLAAACGLAVLSAGLAWAWMIANDNLKSSEEHRASAEANERRAEANLHEAQVMQSRYLADQATQRIEAGDAASAAALALEAVGKAETQEAIDALYRADSALQEIAAFPADSFHRSITGFVVTNAGGSRVAWRSSEMGGIVIWDSAVGQTLGVLPAGSSSQLAHMSADGSRIVTVVEFRSVSVWDAATQRPIATKGSQSSSIHSAFLNGDGKRLAILSYDGRLSIWDLEAEGSRALLAQEHLSVEGGRPHASLSADGRFLATSARVGRAAQIWDLDADPPARRAIPYNPEALEIVQFRLNSTGSRLAAIVWRRDDGPRVVSSSSLEIWDTASGERLGPWEGGLNFVWGLWSPDGRRLLVAPEAGEWRLLDAEEGRLLPHAPPDGEILAWSPDGRRLLIESQTLPSGIQRILIWDVETGAISAAFSVNCLPLSSAVSWNADELSLFWSCLAPLAKGRFEFLMRILDLDAQALLSLYSTYDSRLPSAPSRFGHRYALLRSQTEEGEEWSLQNLETGAARPIPSLEAATDRMDLIAHSFSRDGSRVAVGSEQAGEVQVYSTETGGTLLSLPLALESMAQLNQNGSHLILWEGEEGFSVWRVGAEGAAFWSGKTENRLIFGLSLHPDGSRLAFSDQDGLKILDRTTGLRIIRLWLEETPARDLIWDEEGSRLVGSIIYDETRVWDAETGEELERIALDSEWVPDRFEGQDLRLSRSKGGVDGERVFSRSFSLDWRRQAADLQARLPRRLTCGQRVDFFLDDPESPNEETCARWWEVER